MKTSLSGLVLLIVSFSLALLEVPIFGPHDSPQSAIEAAFALFIVFLSGTGLWLIFKDWEKVKNAQNAKMEVRKLSFFFKSEE